MQAIEISRVTELRFISFMFIVVSICAPALRAESCHEIEAIQAYSNTLTGERREAADFLIKHLPEIDIKELSIELFKENLEQAFIARESYPWTKDLPKKLFHNEVLPHAVVTEARDAWRKTLRELIDPQLSKCKTQTEAYAIVGSQIKELTGVDYSTKREKACQSPAESMRQGMASCTGLSILMVDALRAAGLPARLAVIPLWGTKEGNHTWVEVHDGKSWRFSGYGGSPEQWDKGWEIDRCAYCDPSAPIHEVFASSYKTTAIGFPTIWEWSKERHGPSHKATRNEYGALETLVWNFQPLWVSGIDRTDHYIKLAGGRKLVIPKGKACISVRAFLKGGKTRVDLPVRIIRNKEIIFNGHTASEARDLNDNVRVICLPGKTIVEHQTNDGKWHSQTIDLPANKDVPVLLEVTNR